ncbi:hypothetical protein, partial [Ferrovibrio sp.]|uniref:hypothetical protein n=1 Tax=Ferrovibrio sp. TaxID=1917215 RepID=UPI0035B4E1BB
MTTASHQPLIAFLFRRTVVQEEIIALTRHLIAEGRYRPLILCTQESLATLLPEDVIEASTIALLNGTVFRPKPVPTSAPRPQAVTRPTGLRHRIKLALVAIGPLRALVILRGILIDRAAARALFKTSRPAGLVVFDDRAPRPEMIFLRTASQMRIPSVLAPFAISSIESDIYTRRNSTEHFVEKGTHRWLKRLVARRYPSQVMDTP